MVCKGQYMLVFIYKNIQLKLVCKSLQLFRKIQYNIITQIKLALKNGFRVYLFGIILALLARWDILKVAKATTDTELIGINIAAITGEREPPTANERPMTLYKNEMI